MLEIGWSTQKRLVYLRRCLLSLYRKRKLRAVAVHSRLVLLCRSVHGAASIVRRPREPVDVFNMLYTIKDESPLWIYIQFSIFLTLAQITERPWVHCIWGSVIVNWKLHPRFNWNWWITVASFSPWKRTSAILMDLSVLNSAKEANANALIKTWTSSAPSVTLELFLIPAVSLLPWTYYRLSWRLSETSLLMSLTKIQVAK